MQTLRSLKTCHSLTKFPGAIYFVGSDLHRNISTRIGITLNLPNVALEL